MALFIRWYRCTGCRRFTQHYGSTLELAQQHDNCFHCGGTYAAFTPPFDGWWPRNL